jgi:hypothetical protein
MRHISQPAEVPEEIRDLGVNNVVRTNSGLFIPLTSDPAPAPMGNPHALYPWLRELVFSATRIRQLQSNIKSFSPACSDLIERLQDLIEYMTDYRPRNVAGDLEYELHDGMPLVEDHWRQWFIKVEKPCRLKVMITVETREIDGHGFLPDWRYHVQNPNNETVQVKEITHRIRTMNVDKGRLRNHQFEVVDGTLMRGMDL